jgi:hypothetical protein
MDQYIAVSAPEFSELGLGTQVLTSKDPASLYNACRYATFLADNDIGPWGESNWALPRVVVHPFLVPPSLVFLSGA